MRTLKFDGIAKVGDTIRAYDFQPMEGRKEHYIEGTVRDITFVKPYGYKAYDVVLTYDSMGGRPVGTGIYVPMEVGMDYDGRIKNLTPASLADQFEALSQTLITEGYDSPDGEVGLAYHDAADRIRKVLEFARVNGIN